MGSPESKQELFQLSVLSQHLLSTRNYFKDVETQVLAVPNPSAGWTQETDSQPNSLSQ